MIAQYQKSSPRGLPPTRRTIILDDIRPFVDQTWRMARSNQRIGFSRPLRRFAALLFLFLAMTFAMSARASLWVEFEPPEAAANTGVLAATIGQDSATGALAGLTPTSVVVLYLAPEGAEVESPQDPTVSRIGQLEIDSDGHGELAFTVPEIDPGNYTAYLHCEDCSFDAEGLTFAEAGIFEVVAAQLPRTGSPGTEAFGVAAALVLAGLVILASGRTRGIRANSDTK